MAQSKPPSPHWQRGLVWFSSSPAGRFRGFLSSVSAQPEAFRQQGGRDERTGNGIIPDAQQERTERDEGADARCDPRCGGKSPLSGRGVQRQQDQQDTGAKCRKERRKIRIAERREIKIGVQLPERRCGRAPKLQHRTIGQGLQDQCEHGKEQKRQAFLHGGSSSLYIGSNNNLRTPAGTFRAKRMHKSGSVVEKTGCPLDNRFLVREAGLEPARPEWTLEPESSESANSTTRAYDIYRPEFRTARIL